tara:strand:- start:1035 stop:4025 length:2991 start_codon:yes stop_codon:yes gene_type:complete
MERNMQRSIPHKRNLLCAAISVSLLPFASQSIAQQDTVEEVVVTGSYIRRSEGFTQASSITQLNAEDLANEGTLNLGEVIQNLSFVNGASSAITNTIQGTDSRSSSIDLRGLGPRSTLTLLDGKRLVNQNVNALIPTIALQRIDIVADGAAALYGNEAVAGVVNFVPFKSYDGFKMDTYAEQDSRGDYDEHSIQAMWGGDIGGIDIVLAGQFRSNTRLEWAERATLAESGLTMSSNAPGNWKVPGRDENGVYTGDYANSIDPNCGEREGFVPGQATTAFGSDIGNGTCYFEYGDNRDYRAPTDTNQFFANATYDVSDDLTLSGQFMSSRLYEMTGTSTSNPGGTTRIGQLPAIRGEIPGNPYNAMDSNGNQLYGIDANGDGVPDRQGGVDLNADGWNDYIVSGIANNGVPLNEDIKVRRMRPINKTMANGSNPSVYLPGHTTDMDNKFASTERMSRWFVQADFTVPFIEGWEGQASYTSNSNEYILRNTQVYDVSEVIKGLNCDVANDRDSCYSPFFVTNPADSTQAHVLEAIAARDHETQLDELNVIDIVLNGEVPLFGFELPGGPIAAAIGYQQRDVSFSNTPTSVEQAGNAWIGGLTPQSVTSGNRVVDAYFAEFSIPVLSNLEVSAAVRREEFNTGQESTDPKYGVTYSPTDWLTLRATQGDAFIAPNLEQLYNPVTCGLGTVTDRFGPFDAFTTQCRGGNSNLSNEIAESQQFGFDLTFENWDFHATWNQTDFQNRIIVTSAQTIMDLDYFAFQQFSGFTGDGKSGATQPSLAQTQSWVASGQADSRIIRSPDDIQDILQLNSGVSNAQSVKVTAIDFSANYRLSLDSWGDVSFNLMGTVIDEFLYQENPAAPIIDGAGLYNDRTAAAPNLPELKLNLRVNWVKGDHSISSTVHYIDSMPYDGPTRTSIGRHANTNYPMRIIGGDVNAWTDMDVSYSYRGFETLGGTAAFTLGLRNAFDRQAQRSPEFAGVVGELQDPLGRMIYGRMVYDF